MNTVSSSRKNIQKLQRAIVDGLEDVKAVDIRVFDTEALSPLFERVVIASGSSSRQTKALASSVIDAVRSAGFPKPRTEGEANGEWIIIDCAQAVVHVMQPQIRQYYHLEELWGDKPVRLKLGAAKPLPKAAAAPAGTATPARSTPARQASRSTVAPGAAGAASSSRVARAVNATRAAGAGQPPQPAQSAGAPAKPARPARNLVSAKPAPAGGPAKPARAVSVAKPARTGPAAKAVKTVVVPASSRRRAAPGTRAASAAGRPAPRAKS